MKLFLFARDDDIGIDEYDRVAVIAESETEARYLMASARTAYGYEMLHAPCEEIPLDSARIVMDSFNEG